MVKSRTSSAVCWKCTLSFFRAEDEQKTILEKRKSTITGTVTQQILTTYRGEVGKAPRVTYRTLGIRLTRIGRQFHVPLSVDRIVKEPVDHGRDTDASFKERARLPF